MKHHPAWFAASLLVFVVLACNLSKNSNTNSNANSDLGPGKTIKEVHMAKDDGNGTPGDETDSFATGDRTIHCVATLKSAEAGTRMKFSWWIVDADNTQNQKIRDIDYTTGERENIIHAHLTLPKDWPAGKYKVQVFVNGDLDRTIFYNIK